MIKDFEQLSLNLSQGHPLYDKIVPKNHPLRLIEEQIDFSFVTPLLSDRYSIDYGRPAYSPEVMFKLLFLKCFTICRMSVSFKRLKSIWLINTF